MFWALLAHHQLDVARSHAVSMQPCHSQLTYARNIPNAIYVATPEDEQVMLKTHKVPSILNQLNEKCVTLLSLYWYTMMHGQQNIKYELRFTAEQPFCLTYLMFPPVSPS
jgi:hypothetical protein